EIHAQVTAQSKLFSGAATEFGAEPNSQVSLVDAGMPGMLPVINERAVEQAVRSGLGLNAKINTYSVFDRKNYFYADLPQGYQISQYLQPIVGEGLVSVDLDDGGSAEIRIERLHLEQDAGKLIHDQHPRKSHVDLNRSGLALMEIVSMPDIRSAAEAGAYVRKVRAILRYLGTCDGNMEQGSMRCDVNVSLRRPGAALGTRTETKNVNSIRFVMRAIDFEVRRQIELIEGGGKVVQETLLFDPDKGETRPMRSKEEAHDYRYFPDPDLLPLTFEQSWVDGIAASLPELPDARRQRFIDDYGLTADDADQLVAEGESADYFEAVAKGRDGKLAANWVIHDLFGALNKAELEIAESPVSAEVLGGLIELIANGDISGRIARDVFAEMFESGKPAIAIVEEKGLKQVSDTGEIEPIIDALIADNPGQADQYADNPKVIGWFVGQVMKATKGQANPGVVNDLLRKKLGG
ncbi:MAG: Asp-tRNA(Asn)/Glu-tRNA(Gln) amidotransferase subunit GatB, partial [Alphaproteobacteria bacterium]